MKTGMNKLLEFNHVHLCVSLFAVRVGLVFQARNGGCCKESLAIRGEMKNQRDKTIKLSRAKYCDSKPWDRSEYVLTERWI